MPLGSRRLNEGYILDAVQRAVQIDADSPSGLIWRPGYEAKRATPGTRAGSWNSRTKCWEINIQRMSMHVRHVVWMLASGEAIPIGQDVYINDGDAANMRPDNLSLAPKNERLGPGMPAVQDRLNIKGTPCHFSFITARQPGIHVEIATGRARSLLLAVVDDQFQALAAVAAAGMRWLLLECSPGNEKFVQDRLHPAVREMIERQADRIFTPDVGVVKITQPSFKECFDMHLHSCIEAAKSRAA